MARLFKGKRVVIPIVILSCAFSILILRLWSLQVVEGSQFSKKSENNRLEKVFVSAPRGDILDRNGVLLASSRPAFDLQIVPEDVGDLKGAFRKISSIVGIPEEELNNKFLKGRRNTRRFNPVTFLKDIPRDIVAKIVARKFELPGIIIEPVPARDYRHSHLASHVLGYVREITGEELKSDRYATYMGGDIVGKSGVEAGYEKFLQGIRGTKRVVVNAKGVRVEELSSKDVQSGHKLKLTIDAEIQNVAEEAFGDKTGSVVAINPQNGHIIALASKFSYDPEVFVGELDPKVWKKLSSGKLLLNKGIQATYPPGSVFKIIVALAGLSEGKINPKTRVRCPGYYTFGKRRYRCWKKSGHGSVDLRRALVSSCDVYFYHLGHLLGIDNIHKYSSMFGLGLKTGVDLPSESAGLIPSRAWKAKAYRDPAQKTWFPGETLSVAIGQGAVVTTPIQIANMLSTVVNGGRRYTPSVVDKVLSVDTREIESGVRGEKPKETNIDLSHLSLVVEALKGVVNSPGGTGGRARLKDFPEIFVGGKTGTAQVVGLQFHGKRKDFEDHAWFAGFAPVDNPKIVVAVIVEHGGHGGSAAAPVAQKVMNAFFLKYGKEGLPAEVSAELVDQGGEE